MKTGTRPPGRRPYRGLRFGTGTVCGVFGYGLIGAGLALGYRLGRGWVLASTRFLSFVGHGSVRLALLGFGCLVDHLVDVAAQLGAKLGARLVPALTPVA